MVSAILDQFAAAQVLSARPPVCFRWPPLRLLSLVSATSSRRPMKTNSSSAKALELGTLHPTLDQSFAFSPWPLTIADQARTHDDDLIYG